MFETTWIAIIITYTPYSIQSIAFLCNAEPRAQYVIPGSLTEGVAGAILQPSWDAHISSLSTSRLEAYGLCSPLCGSATACNVL